MPELNFTEILKIEAIDENTYDYRFSLDLDKELCIDALYIYINCDYCVKKINGFNIDNKERIKEVYDFTARVGKEIIEDKVLPNFKLNFTIALNASNYNFTLYLNTMKNSKDYIDYMSSFGEASCNARKKHIVSDTLFRYDIYSP